MARTYSDDYTPEEGFVRLNIPTHKIGELESADHGVPVSRISEFNTGRTRDDKSMSISELADDIRQNGIQNHVHVGFHRGIPTLHNGNHRYLGAVEAGIPEMPAAVPVQEHKQLLHWLQNGVRKTDG